ncbi:putative carbonic anhydrase protein [Botrytis fragariae]|uniref:Putative carbonic anhydrase protein n=1 Tax=Botrytis fragariae TaxID=1964551 RepID=A0A8H6EE38_9HELO|nr:putative carbonic anhydrase protein [Botrytis fragariae]KAF5868937.1 putative carbonic anhydrase protein [Botrytis fragariae]
MSKFILAATLLSAVMACPDHDLSSQSLMKRADGPADWAYDAAYNWGMINENYTTCQTGTQQSPIHLTTSTGYSKTHAPTFNYSTSTSGSLYNWGYGPAFSLTSNVTDLSGNPSMTFDNETVFLKGWHIHAPADHTIDSARSKAELHFVHATASGAERAVVAFMIDPIPFGTVANSTFFDSFPLSSIPSFSDATTRIPLDLDLKQALTEINNAKDFWTYEGSLTSPPCTEGMRWFVAGKKMLVGTEQMQEILAVSTYSAREEQGIWGHNINV